MEKIPSRKCSGGYKSCSPSSSGFWHLNIHPSNDNCHAVTNTPTHPPRPANPFVFRTLFLNFNASYSFRSRLLQVSSVTTCEGWARAPLSLSFKLMYYPRSLRLSPIRFPGWRATVFDPGSVIAFEGWSSTLLLLPSELILFGQDSTTGRSPIDPWENLRYSARPYLPSIDYGPEVFRFPHIPRLILLDQEILRLPSRPRKDSTSTRLEVPHRRRLVHRSPVIIVHANISPKTQHPHPEGTNDRSNPSTFLHISALNRHDAESWLLSFHREHGHAPSRRQSVLPSNRTSKHSWGPEPRGRGSPGILINCVLTLGLCAWTAILVDPTPDRRWRWAFREKFTSATTAMLAPEVILGVAASECSDARRLHTSWCGDRDITPGSKQHTLGMAGAHHVCMRGVTIYPPHRFLSYPTCCPEKSSG